MIAKIKIAIKISSRVKPGDGLRVAPLSAGFPLRSNGLKLRVAAVFAVLRRAKGYWMLPSSQCFAVPRDT